MKKFFRELLDVASSVGAAFLGVQSNKKRKKDFGKSNYIMFLVVGIIATIIFIFAIRIFVDFLLETY